MIINPSESNSMFSDKLNLLPTVQKPVRFPYTSLQWISSVGVYWQN